MARQPRASVPPSVFGVPEYVPPEPTVLLDHAELGQEVHKIGRAPKDEVVQQPHVAPSMSPYPWTLYRPHDVDGTGGEGL
jgi:hypothetical protein